MKVLLVTIDFPPLPGGISRYYGDLARHWNDDELVILAPEIPGARETDEHLPVRVHRRPFFRRVPTKKVMREIPATWYHTRRLVGELDPDLLLCGQPMSTGVVGHLAAGGRPVVVFAHGEELRRPWSSPWRMKLMGRVLRRASRVVVVSEYSRREVERYGVPADKIIKKTGIDPGPWEGGEIPLPAGDLPVRLGDDPVILTVGRLGSRKGHDILINAFLRVRESVPRAVLVVVGEGPAGKELWGLVDALGLTEAVIFCGRVGDEELRWLYRRARVFCLASREGTAGQVEGLGLVFLEAGAAGTPVVGTRVGGVPDAVVHGETGLLVDPDSPPMLAEALIDLLNDKEKAGRLGEGGKRRVRELFDWRQNAPALRKELATLVRENRRGRQ